jgi:hypothetical protein
MRDARGLPTLQELDPFHFGRVRLSDDFIFDLETRGNPSIPIRFYTVYYRIRELKIYFPGLPEFKSTKILRK